MLDDPERRVCPLCKRSFMTLIATMTGARARHLPLRGVSGTIQL